ncbi:hypothetical protein ASD11_12480 [Aeromicrobium sp. Root495]|uniref:Flp pilus assembly protein CpaB n=1 Tax=Aeromicrobium sp. Root495 TaxID=1736550 RepID=UPI0006FFFFD7|nr:RcpC/CpaB family pilus assembly protein [Aeromicrobium sp. Root495]KQY60273.1 hypothetical protein ASD11_12480 [Aeromicrobium sp. Root495]
MNKQVLAIVGAAVLALLGFAAVVIYAKGADDRALEGTETVTVLRVTQEVPMKTPVEELGASVESAKVPKAAVVDGALTSLDSVAGQVTSTTLVPGDQITSLKFAESGKVKGDLTVPKGMQTLTIPLTSERWLGGTLKPGDKVGVMASYGSGNGGVTGNPIKSLLVIKVAANEVVDGGGGDNATSQLTVAAKTLDAEKIVHALEFGKVWLTLQNADSDTDGGKTITQKDVTP